MASSERTDAPSPVDSVGLVTDVLAALADTSGVGAVLDACAQAIVDRLDAAMSRIWTLNEAARVLELQASAGLPVDAGEPYMVPVGNRTLRHVIESRRADVVDDIRADPQFDRPEWAEREGIVSFAAYPLTYGDRLVGVVTVFARQPLPAECRGHLGQVADAIATHVERVRRQQQLRDEHAVLVQLQEVTATLLSVQFDLEQVVQKVTDAATEISGAAFGAFFYKVVDDLGETSMLYTLSGAAKEACEHIGFPRKTPLFEPTYRGVGPIRLDDVVADPRYGRKPPHHGMPPGHLPVRSYLAVPVVGRAGDVLGALFLGHPQPGRFDEAAEIAVTTVAGQAAIAIENAYFYQVEHSAAATLQQSLLPRGLPTLAGAMLAARYQPAGVGHEVGGDWYDALVLPDGRLALTVGDVCGHDMEAAATMGQLRAAMRAYALDDPDPSRVVARIEDFCALTTMRGFTTLVQALYDPARHTFEFVRAGHPAPLIIEPDGTCEIVDAPGVPPVGNQLIDPERLPQVTTTVSLAPGSTVLLYTDGLIERRGWTVQEGLANLVATARQASAQSLDRLCEHLINRLADHRHDDTAVLALAVAT